MIGKEIFERLKKRYGGETFRILFCPYKEEMWDSMQSVYESAMADEDTFTEIMPIPYFLLDNMLPSKAEMEFMDCSQNFPSILNDDWDVIVFHYPYDQYNNLTRPLLTSYMLKFFCKHLVFIHYALFGDRDIVEIDTCFPAYKNSDLIILENDRVAKQFTELLKKQGLNTECVGWGSPKYDNIKAGNLPKEWIPKVDCREIILLQTSIIPLMNDPDRLNKVEAIINEYKDNDNVCIWWRPHPLYEQTLNVHRKSDLPHYYKMVREFKKSRHIYDDTTDLHRAIALSDRMISDKSSVVKLYEATGKPITMF